MENSKFQEKMFEKLEGISKQLTQIETHASYTKQSTEENKAEIKEVKRQVTENTSEIKSFNEWREALDRIIWEILKPPLKFVGLAGFLIICMVGGWLILR